MWFVWSAMSRAFAKSCTVGWNDWIVFVQYRNGCWKICHVYCSGKDVISSSFVVVEVHDHYIGKEKLGYLSQIWCIWKLMYVVHFIQAPFIIHITPTSTRFDINDFRIKQCGLPTYHQLWHDSWLLKRPSPLRDHRVLWHSSPYNVKMAETKAHQIFKSNLVTSGGI